MPPCAILATRPGTRLNKDRAEATQSVFVLATVYLQRSVTGIIVHFQVR